MVRYRFRTMYQAPTVTVMDKDIKELVKRVEKLEQENARLKREIEDVRRQCKSDISHHERFGHR